MWYNFVGWCLVPPGRIYETTMTSVHLGKCIESHFWVRGWIPLCQWQREYENDGWWLGHTAWGHQTRWWALSFSHCWNVIFGIDDSSVSVETDLHTHTWLVIRQTVWIRVSYHTLSSRSPVLLKGAFQWLTSYEKVVLIFLSSKVSHSVQNHSFIFYVRTVAVCSYWWLLYWLWQSKWWQQ